MQFTLKNHSDAPVNAPMLDWSQTPLATEYNGFYVKVLDDVFTPTECAALTALAESDQKWEQAAVNYGLKAHEKLIDTSYRNSERILRFDADAAEQLYHRLLPYVQELVEIRPGGEWETIVANKIRTTTVWKMIGYTC